MGEREINGFKIEADVPLPAGQMRGRTGAIRALEPGESVFFPGVKSGWFGSTFNRIPGKFTRRAVDGGVRVWRIA